MPKFIITTTASSINDPAPEARVETSRRRSRAVRHAKKLRRFNHNVMLFENKGNEWNEQWQPVSLQEFAEKRRWSDGCTSHTAGLPLDIKEPIGRRGGAALDHYKNADRLYEALADIRMNRKSA